ncbi:heterotrimeric G-protein alpha subunit, GPA3-like protein [Mycena epipterygia]|nr:heterotrimeric G-protein alpha subunit, GPA3-like protein [Mycena epipterygia]
MEDCKRHRRECSILLLGTHDSGKSMLMKQMKMIHQGFDVGELAEYRTTIYRNVLDSAGTLARVVRQVGVGALEEGEHAHAALLLAAFPAAGTADKEGDSEATNAMLTPALADAIWHIARAPAVERLLDEFYLIDSASYFFASIHRIAAPTYVPSEEDIIRTSANSTTAIVEMRLRMGDFPIRIIDVGGLRSERRKWIHCFQNVTSIIFCTALSEYDQELLLGERRNRLRESVALFDSVINSRWFRHTCIILFLNKVDVFQRKLPKIPLERYFPEYTGGNDLQKAAKFILWTFMQANHARLSVYPHVTRATDTNNVRLVFSTIKETILKGALKNSWLFRDSDLL